MTELDPILLEQLTQVNLDDIATAFGLRGSPFGRSIVRLIFQRQARRFAGKVLWYDAGVAEGGLAEGARRILPALASEVVVEGAQAVPQQGPVLFLSNHPGLADTLSLFTAIPRPDVKILASERPFLDVLKATRQRLILIPSGPEGRTDALRAAASHLRGGGALLTFPAGKIEPDPAVIGGAVDSLDGWNPSTGLFVRLVPELQIVPVIVSGVLAPQAIYHPLTRMRRKKADREWLGATLQLIVGDLRPGAWPVRVRVRFAPPLLASEMVHLREPQAITRAITDRLRPFLSEIVRSDFKKP